MVTRTQPSGPLCLWQCFACLQWTTFALYQNMNLTSYMNVSFSSFQVVCYWGTWANYRPEGGDKTCFQKNEIVIACLLSFWHLILSAPNFQENSLQTTLMPPSAHISSTGSSLIVINSNTPRNYFTLLYLCSPDPFCSFAGLDSGNWTMKSLDPWMDLEVENFFYHNDDTS